ncbi:c-type cytochrome [Polyangium aurulentum]|uniref:c-type cytochrome n=1 Tax=Polyangium aurulentum TaxID=2567896 RepID=UPI001F34547E|nr:c-type cytochrome [Polyangium aurulentum]
MRTSDHKRPLALLLLALVGAATVAGAGCSGTENPPIPGNDVVVAAKTPPAISGGTLITTKDATTAVASDPDRDRVWIVDLVSKSLKSEVLLEEGDEPGRVVEDANGRAHVALRAGGAVATIDIASGKLIDRRDVCNSPRGIAYDSAGDKLHVACAGGQLVTLPAAGGEATRVLRLDRDLRDVVVQGDKLVVTRFRSSELLVVGLDGKVWQRARPPASAGTFDQFGFEQNFEPAVAWRMVSKPSGGAVLVHQRAVTTPVVVTQPGGYGGTGGGCDGGIVRTTVTEVEPGSETIPVVLPTTPGGNLPHTALPVDVAMSATNEVTVVAAGSNTIFRTHRDFLNSVSDCDPPGEPAPGQPVAAAYAGDTKLVVQIREPAALWIPDGNVTIALPGESVRDTGHDLFHKSPSGSGSLSCASCHPEGQEDGRTWNFDPIGPRRTQTIGGGILATAPLHWDGDMQDMNEIMSEVFVNRMGGTDPGPRHARLIARYVDALPVLPREEPVDTAAVERGKALYESEAVGCATCHTGGMLTNNESVDVGTGKAFQVPTLLGIADRAPYMHTGCAPTLRDRFTNPECGGGDKHGRTSQLSAAQIDDLVAYLETL